MIYQKKNTRFMMLFGKKNIFLGIDCGASAVKIVEITYKNQRPHLTNYAYIPITQSGDVLPALRAGLKAMQPATTASYVALPGSSGLVTLITFPIMAERELEQAVLFEARKHIPVPLEDVNVSWDLVGRTKDESTQPQPQAQPSTQSGEAAVSQQTPSSGGQMHVLLVAAPRKDVTVYEEFMRSASLELRALELETFSLVRSLIGEDAGRFLIMDIGARSTNLVLVERGVIRANRNVGVGGDAMTKAVADALGVNSARAEEYKCTPPASEQENPFRFMQGTIDALLEEARRVMRANAQTPVDGVMITGGGSGIVGIEPYVSNALGIKATIGNPWARITIDQESAAAAQELQGTFAVAVGLALRGVEEYRRQ